MAQIKYVVFACLILLSGFIALIVLQKLSSAPIIAIETRNDIGPSSQSHTRIIDTDVSKGGQLFKTNCGSCHALDKVLSGPALRGVMTRGPWVESKENLMKWVRNPSAFIPTTQYTKDLQKIYGQIMPSFPSSQITDEELEAIVQYLNGGPVPMSISPS